MLDVQPDTVGIFLNQLTLVLLLRWCVVCFLQTVVFTTVKHNNCDRNAPLAAIGHDISRPVPPGSRLLALLLLLGLLGGGDLLCAVQERAQRHPAEHVSMGLLDELHQLADVAVQTLGRREGGREAGVKNGAKRIALVCIKWVVFLRLRLQLLSRWPLVWCHRRAGRQNVSSPANVREFCQDSGLSEQQQWS